MTVLYLRAPRAAVVRALGVATGSKVAADQLIVSLDSEEESKALLDVTQTLAQIEAYAVSVSDSNVSSRVGKLEEIVADAKSVMDDDMHLLNLIRNEINAGTRVALDLYPISERLVVSSDAFTKAKSALDQYKYDVATTRAYNVELKKLAMAEDENARAQIRRMQITAPSAGVVSIFASLGQYVPTGFVLGTIK